VIRRGCVVGKGCFALCGSFSFDLYRVMWSLSRAGSLVQVWGSLILIELFVVYREQAFPPELARADSV
jgi:hypothetical protein